MLLCVNVRFPSFFFFNFYDFFLIFFFFLSHVVLAFFVFLVPKLGCLFRRQIQVGRSLKLEPRLFEKHANIFFFMGLSWRFFHSRIIIFLTYCNKWKIKGFHEPCECQFLISLLFCCCVMVEKKKQDTITDGFLCQVQVGDFDHNGWKLVQ